MSFPGRRRRIIIQSFVSSHPFQDFFPLFTHELYSIRIREGASQGEEQYREEITVDEMMTVWKGDEAKKEGKKKAEQFSCSDPGAVIWGRRRFM